MPSKGCEGKYKYNIPCKECEVLLPSKIKRSRICNDCINKRRRVVPAIAPLNIFTCILCDKERKQKKPPEDKVCGYCNRKRAKKPKNKEFTKVYIRTCVWCHEDFETRRSAQGNRYCSHEHYREAFNDKRRKTKEEYKPHNSQQTHVLCCKVCGEEVTSTKNRSVASCDKCKREKCRQYNIIKYYSDTPECRRNKRLSYTYEVNIEWFENRLAEQRGGCAICGFVPTGNWKQYNRLVVDHDHSTNNIRGLICDICNHAIGLFRDNPLYLYKGADYCEEV